MRDILIIAILLLISNFSVAQRFFNPQSGEPDVHEFIYVDHEPKPLNIEMIQRQIPYPVKAMRAGIGGKVFFRVLVDEYGNYQKHKVTRTIDPMLVAAAEPYIRKLRFSPAFKDRQPVKYWVNIPVEFNPQKGSFGTKREILLHQSFFHRLIASTRRSEKYLKNGYEAMTNGEFYEASEALSKSIDYNPRKLKGGESSGKVLCYAYFLRARNYANMGKWEQANRDITEAIGIYSTIEHMDEELIALGPELFLERAFFSMVYGQTVRAANDISWMEKNFSDRVYVVENYFEKYPLSDREILTCRKSIGQLQKTFPTNEPLMTLEAHLGFFLDGGEMGSYDLPSVGDFADLIETREVLGLIAEMDYERAFAAAETLLEESPEDADLHLVKAYLFSKIGAMEEACNELREISGTSVSVNNSKVYQTMEKLVCSPDNSVPLSME